MIILLNIVTLFLFLRNLIIEADGIKPKIIHSPSDTYGLENQQISLRCESESSSDSISWIKDGKSLGFSGKILSFQLNRASEGKYSCNVTDATGLSVISPNATVKIAFLDKFSQTVPVTRFVSPGATLLLQCDVPAGLPTPDVNWRSNTTAFNYRFKYDSQFNLRIDDVRRTDNGFYWCEVKNTAFTRLSPPTQLKVIQRPSFLMLPQHFQVMIGDSVRFPCVVVGDLPMFVQWYKLGSSSGGSSEPVGSMSRAHLGTNCSLLVAAVRLTDRGAYVCQAHNSGGITELIFRLSVISQPSFLETPVAVRAPLGSAISLHCTATGVPHPSIFWRHNANDYLLSDSAVDRVRVHENGTLSILSLRPDDAGRYICYAVSFVGSSQSEASVSATMPTGIFPPVISEGPLNTTALEGNTVVLQCRTSSPDCASFIWFKQLLRIVVTTQFRSRIQLASSGDLIISEAKIQDSASYTCRVSCHNLYAEKTAQLIVKSYSEMGNARDFPPSRSVSTQRRLAPVQNVTVEFVGDKYLLVSWRHQGGASPTNQAAASAGKFGGLGFQVEVATQQRSLWRVVGNTAETRMLIAGLQPDTGYRLLVRPVKWRSNKIGPPTLYKDVVYTLNKPTISLDVTFGEFHKALQEIEILKLNLFSLSSNQVKVTWRVRGGDIIKHISGFIIKAEPVSIRRCLLMEDSAAAGASGSVSSLGAAQKTMEELQTTLPFDCLQSRNRRHLEDLLSRYEEGRKQPVQSPARPTSQKYRVLRDVTHERSSSAAIIGGLAPFTCYEVDIETFIEHVNAGRISGRDSVTRTVLTLDDVPLQAPTLRGHRWVSNDTFQLAWSALEPSVANGPIVGYLVQLLNVVTNQLFSYEVPPKQLQYHVRLRRPQDRHVLYLCAKSCRSRGPRSRPLILDRLAATSVFWNPSGVISDSQQKQQHEQQRQQTFLITIISGSLGFGLLLVVTIVLLLVCRQRHLQPSNSNGCHDNRNIMPPGSVHKPSFMAAVTPQQQQQRQILMKTGMMMLHNPDNSEHSNEDHGNEDCNNTNSCSANKSDQRKKLLSNYETILPFEVGFSPPEMDAMGGCNCAVTTPRFACTSVTGSGQNSGPATAGTSSNCVSLAGPASSESLAYASSSLVYKGCQHYTPSGGPLPLPPQFHHYPAPGGGGGGYLGGGGGIEAAQFMAGSIIPPPPMYPPPPAPSALQHTASDVMSPMEAILGASGSNHGSNSRNNTHSSAGSSSNKSTSTHRTAPRSSVAAASRPLGAHSTNPSLNSSSASSRGRQNTARKPKTIKKESSLSNSSHSSNQKARPEWPPGGGSVVMTTSRGPTPGSSQVQLLPLTPDAAQQQTPTRVRDNEDEEEEDRDAVDADEENEDEDDELTSEQSDVYLQTGGRYGGDDDLSARESDSVRVMYKMPLKRPQTPDYSTDSSCPYSTANHYSSHEPPHQLSRPPVMNSGQPSRGVSSLLHNNLPTKF